jgi:hypothetical protein
LRKLTQQGKPFEDLKVESENMTIWSFCKKFPRSSTHQVNPPRLPRAIPPPPRSEDGTGRDKKIH